MNVEVVYALAHEQALVSVEVADGACVIDAIRASGLLTRYPEIDLEQNKVGIFGKQTKLDALLQPADRVEIYRPLIADPKEVRRQRAAQGKATKKGGGALHKP